MSRCKRTKINKHTVKVAYKVCLVLLEQLDKAKCKTVIRVKLEILAIVELNWIVVYN